MILAVLSGKDGVGKSTVSANLGLALANTGARTLVVEADLRSSTLHLIYGLDTTLPTLQDHLEGSNMTEEVVAVYSDAENLNVVPGSSGRAPAKPIDPKTFDQFISEAGRGHDFVIIDAPGGLGMDTLAVMSASDSALIVTTPDISAVSGGLKIKVLGERLNTKVIGIVVNRKGSDHDIPDEYIREMIGGIDVIGAIPEDPVVRVALQKGKPLLLTNQDSGAAIGIINLARTIKA